MYIFWIIANVFFIVLRGANVIQFWFPLIFSVEAVVELPWIQVLNKFDVLYIEVPSLCISQVVFIINWVHLLVNQIIPNLLRELLVNTISLIDFNWTACWIGDNIWFFVFVLMLSRKASEVERVTIDYFELGHLINVHLLWSCILLQPIISRTHKKQTNIRRLLIRIVNISWIIMIRFKIQWHTFLWVY